MHGHRQELVNAVLTLAGEPSILTAAGSPVDTPSLWVSNDVELACEYANVEEPDECVHPSCAWRELRARLSSDPGTPLDGAIESGLNDFYARRMRFAPLPCDDPRGEFGQIVEWAYADLRMICRQRAAQGYLPGSFFEELLSVYRLGLWPCGWQGACWSQGYPRPAGRFLAWQRPVP